MWWNTWRSCWPFSTHTQCITKSYYWIPETCNLPWDKGESNTAKFEDHMNLHVRINQASFGGVQNSYHKDGHWFKQGAHDKEESEGALGVGGDASVAKYDALVTCGKLLDWVCSKPCMLHCWFCVNCELKKKIRVELNVPWPYLLIQGWSVFAVLVLGSWHFNIRGARLDVLLQPRRVAPHVQSCWSLSYGQHAFGGIPWWVRRGEPNWLEGHCRSGERTVCQWSTRDGDNLGVSASTPRQLVAWAPCMFFKSTRPANARGALALPITENPMLKLWKRLTHNSIISNKLSEYFKVTEIAHVQVLGMRMSVHSSPSPFSRKYSTNG